LKLKKLSDSTIEEAVIAWNRGFEGYFVKIDMTAETFMNRVINEGISFDFSRVLFDENEPVAIILNGFRSTSLGNKISWNGGTGVAPAYRGKGASRILMEGALRIYQDEGIEIATLEAIKENERAIRLYEKYGYQITDQLMCLTGSLQKIRNFHTITSITIRPEQLSMIPQYNGNGPWQCQWQSVKQGEAQIYYDEYQNFLGYSLYKRIWDKEGKLERVILYQIELLQRGNEKKLYPSIFKKIAGDEIEMVTFYTLNFSLENPATKYLLENGLKKTTEQVQMKKKY
jgi:GNAT superfamily N-acetyltransferase